MSQQGIKPASVLCLASRFDALPPERSRPLILFMFLFVVVVSTGFRFL